MKNLASRTAHRIMVFAAAALLAGAVQTQAQTPPAIVVPHLYLGSTIMGLTISGAVGSNYLVQCVTDLARSNNWQTLTNFALPDSPYIWVDTRGAATNHRYYRVIASGPYAAAVALSGLAWDYDGTAKAASVTTEPANLAVEVTYNGSAELPVNAGNYSVVARVTGTNYIGAATNTLVIATAAAAVDLSGLLQFYTGLAQSVTVTTDPAGLPVEVTYNGSATLPTNVANYTAVATVTSTNYFGAATNTFVIAAQSQTISFPALAARTYGDASFALSATASSGLPVSYGVDNTNVARLSGGTVTITGSGTARLVASQAGNTNYTAALSATNTLTVNQAGLTVTADAQTKAAGDTNPDLTAAFNGFVNGDNASVISGVPALSTTADTSSPAGTYPITVELGTLSAANYGFSFVAGTLTVTSGTTPTNALAGMVLIPAGWFTMGNSIGDSDITDATPTNTYVSAFYMDTNLVSYSQWHGVYSWATSHGYGFLNEGDCFAANHPVYMVDWYDCAKWCNARSQRAGLRPVYYTSADFTQVFTNGDNGTTVYQSLAANGYRLPTEAEWEKAARGGLSGQRFPWGNTISDSEANYYSSRDCSYDMSNTGYNPTFGPGTSPVGYFAANGYGLYDMAGNVFEWCSDWYGTPYAGGADPRGPISGSDHVTRGGYWSFRAGDSRTARRFYARPERVDTYFGFRTVTGNQAGLTVTVDNKAKAVGFINPVLTATLSGFVNGDNASVISGVPALSTTATTWSPAGTYPITVELGTLSASNYGFIFVAGTLTVTNATSPTNTPAGAGMVLIPAGSFVMGDTFGEGDSDELPLHTSYVSAFYMDKNLVNYALWQQVYSWAITHGYSFDYAGSGKATNHPVHTIDWYDAVKWCNARSEKEGRVPSYYTDAGFSVPYRTGQTNVRSDWVLWASGYRLPTEAEWEKAARGGLSGQRFPWGNTISTSEANYYSSRAYSYDMSSGGYNPTFDDRVIPFTSPVGYFGANGYGVCDMAGNLYQWTWDSYGSYSSSSQTDPRGPSSGNMRVVRGGGWFSDALECRAAYRSRTGYTVYAYEGIGFRSVLPQKAGLAVRADNKTKAAGDPNPVLTATLSGFVNGDNASVISGVPALSTTAATGSSAGTYAITAALGTLSASNYGFIFVAGTLTVTNATSPTNTPAGAGMVLIPAGSFVMGNTFGEGYSGELPFHTSYVSAFYMDTNLVSYALWQQVYSWAIANGYSFDCPGSGKASTHPVQMVDWYDCVKWCNARSEKEGRVPAYYREAGQVNVYRGGQTNVQNDWVKWSSGYRLPTEAEWEKAARGGASGQRFPWGNTISWGQANYYASPGYGGYDVNGTSGYHPTFNDGVYPYTSPVGTFAANGYGLYDMAGNVWQWCWDWLDWYSSNSQSDPRGPVLPTSGSFRVLRGGCWDYDASHCRAANRNYYDPGHRYNYRLGFRSALPTGQ